MHGPVEHELQPAATAEVPAARPGRGRTVGFALATVAILALLYVLLRPRPTADAVWSEARLAFEARDFPTADRLIRELGRLRPEPTALDSMLRAQVAMGLGRDAEAFEDLKHVPDGHPMAPAARLEMGQMALRASRYAAAETYFLRCLGLDPKRVQARRELIFIYGITSRRPELNAAFRSLAEVSPLTFNEVFLWCLTRGVTWEPEEIVRTLGKALVADPTDRWSRLGMAKSEIDLSRIDAAEATLAPLPDSDPEARVLRVRIALARGDDQGAEALLDGGPDDNAGLALLRGQLALARGDARATLHHYRIAYKAAPYLREAVFGLGKALQINNDPAAATYLDQATKLDLFASLMQKAALKENQTDMALVRNLGAACASVGRIPEARAWYSIAIDRDPLDIKAQQALARLGPTEPIAEAH